MNQFSSTLSEALAVFEAFRRLGYLPNNIFAMYSDAKLYMVLKNKDKEFTIEVGDLHGVSEQDFPALWGETAEAYNKLSDEEAIKIWNGSIIKDKFFQLAELLKNKGLIIPKLMN